MKKPKETDSGPADTAEMFANIIKTRTQEKKLLEEHKMFRVGVTEVFPQVGVCPSKLEFIQLLLEEGLYHLADRRKMQDLITTYFGSSEG